MNIPAFSVRNPVLVNLLMCATLISGFYYWFNLVREFFPPLDAEQITIHVPYPGATPEDLEQAIALRIERQLRDINGIDEIDSSVFEGYCSILLTLEEDTDRDRVLNEVRSAVDLVKPEFPKSAEDPKILEVRPYIPVISLVVSGDAKEERLREAAIDVRNDLIDLGGISEVYLIGKRNREIWAEVKPERLEEFNLTLDEVGGAISRGNVDVPGGQLKGEKGNIRVRTMGKSTHAGDIEKLVVAAGDDGTAIRLADIALVRDTFEDRVMRGRYSGKRAVELIIFKTPEQDALDIAAKVKAYVKDHPTLLGGAVNLETTIDLSRLIEGRIDLMVRNARMGLILVVITLALFLSVRTSFWVAAGLLISLLGAFTVMAFAGATINLLSLFALILVLGLIVDDAVVIGESVHTRMQQGMDPMKAAVVGSNEVARPVIAAVITSVIAFGPLAYMDGTWGDLLGVIPVVVSAALFVSLLEAFVILPCHLGHRRKRALPWENWGISKRVASFRERILEKKFRDSYERLLRHTLRWRYPALALCMAILLATSGLVTGGVVPFQLLQDVDAEQITVTLEMSAGSPEGHTMEVVDHIERLALDRTEVKSVFSVVGVSFSDRGQQGNADPATVGQLYLELLPADERETEKLMNSSQLIEELREQTLFLPGVDKIAWRSENGAVPGADIEVRVRGKDLAVTSDAADRIHDLLLGYEGITEIENDLREGKLEVRLRLKDEARSLGLDTESLARQMRNAFFGFEAQELQESQDEVKVRILLPLNARRTLADLGRLRIETPMGGRVPLEEVADMHMNRGLASLKRVDAKRAVTVRAEVDETRGNVQEITDDLALRISDIENEFPGVSVTFEGRQKETRESFGSLFIGFPIALLAIFAFIAVLFGSYTQPFIVMAIIPFSIVGAILGHYVTGTVFTLLSMVGVVGLAGIVVNDSLILVDRVNRNKNGGMPLLAAVVDGGRSRLRAIVLTTITTAAGLFPLLLERSFQAQFLIPMGISIVFGLMFATVLTLLLLPCLYLILEDLRLALRWIRTGRYGDDTIQPSDSETPSGSPATS